ncbi:MAG: alpha/beta hydrolase [Hyphomonadaceae bacterium]|nr:alpha/beta hydrolase [Hyphomonadaceae bacterium]
MTVEYTDETDHGLFHTGSYSAALELVSAYIPDGELDLEERIEIGLSLADEQVERGHLALAMTTLTAALEDASTEAYWLAPGAVKTRVLTIRILDKMALLHFQLGQNGLAFLRARAAYDLSEDIDDPDAQAMSDRLDLIRSAAELSGREDFISEAAGLVSPAAPGQGYETVGARTPGRRRTFNAPASEEDPGGEPPFHEVPVYFATHRNRTGRSNPYDYFRGKRANLSLGRAVVTVPRDREAGDFDTASRRSWKSADKAKVITIDTLALLEGRDAFVSEIKADMASSSRKEALVFIHGYNTSFAGALMRAGQLSVDLNIDGATLLYSWPSKASFMSYVVDRNQVIDPFLEDLKDLIVDMALETGARRVHLLAHSMGAQFLLDTLAQAKLDDPRVEALDGPLADEVIFASPDVDAENFVGRVQRVSDLAGRITVYSSREDKALKASELLQGSPRAGRVPDVVSTAGVDAVDTTAAEQDLLGHSDYSKSAIDDVRALIWLPTRVSPAKRAAILRPDEGGSFWHYKGAAAQTLGLAFRSALRLARQFGVDEAFTKLEGGAGTVTPAGAGADSSEIRQQLEALRG